ncbi:MAG: hypothetical protein AAGJ46_09965 [Planctomycetota bacterium]
MNPANDNPAAAPIDSPQGEAVSPEHVESAKRQYRFLRLLAAMSLVMGSLCAVSLNLVDPDLWGHVTYGREAIADGQLHLTATHTFTAEGYRWINHENLAELAMAWGFDTLGVRGMLVAKLLLGGLILGAMYLVARSHGVRMLAAWSLLLVVATNLKAFFILRPQLLSFVCCAAMLVLLDLAFRDWAFRHWASRDGRSERNEGETTCRVRWPWLLAVPVLMVVWVNSHGGFVAGYCILGALLAGRIVEAVAIDGRKAIATVAGMATVGVVCLAGLLANPYGTGLLEWLVESLGTARPEITEWAAPKPSDPVFWPFFTLLAVNAIAWAFTDRRRDWTQLLILSLVAWQSCQHLRHIAFLALLTGFWTPVHVQAVVARLRSRAASGLPVTRIGPVFKWGAATALAGAMFVQAWGLADRLSNLPVTRKMYPVDAFDFLSLHGINGRMVVSFNWAQYALYAFPESTVSFDGRFRTCYPQEVVDMNFDWLLGEHGGLRRRSPNSGPIDGERVLEHGDPEIVIVDRNYPAAVAVMEKQYQKPDGEWALLYQDAVSQVWGRKRVFDSPESDRYLPMAARVASDAPRPFAVPWPADPLKPREPKPVENREVAEAETAVDDNA